MHMLQKCLFWVLLLIFLHLRPDQLWVDCIKHPNVPVPNGAFIPRSFHVGERTIRHHDDNGTAINSINNYPHDHFFIRNVPGDGSCLFHSLAVCLRQKVLQCHQEEYDEKTRELSKWLRVQVKSLYSFTPHHFTSLYFSSLHFTSLHFTSLHLAPLELTLLDFT